MIYMTRPKLKVKKGDLVQIILGKDKGRRGVIERVFPRDNKVLVEGANVVSKHVKSSVERPEGGVVRKCLPIHVSNVSLIDPSTDLPSKVGYRIDEDGNKVRFFKKTGHAL